MRRSGFVSIRARRAGVLCAILLASLVPADPSAAAATDGADLTPADFSGPVTPSADRMAPRSSFSAAPRSSFFDFGCFEDPVGDVIDLNTGEPADVAEADLVVHCVDYTQRALSVFALVDAPTDPASDPNWEGFTTVRWWLDTTADGNLDYVIGYYLLSGVLTATVHEVELTDDVVTFSDVICEGTAVFSEDIYFARAIDPVCIGSPASVHLVTQFYYQDLDDPEDPIYYDQAPEELPLHGPIDQTQAQCGSVEILDEREPVLSRISCSGTSTTQAITQSIAVSEFTFDDFEATHAVIARDDAFPDALAGSALGYGLAPLLFTHSPSSAPSGVNPQRLAPATRRELERVLAPGSTVYLLGGTEALGAGLEAELAALDYEVRRLAGATRFETARLISAEVDRLIGQFDSDFPRPPAVMVATGVNWPDAVAAGQVAAFWGIPVLLTQRDVLHPSTVQALQSLRPEWIYVIGGEAVVSQSTAVEASSHATPGRANPGCLSGQSCRVWGQERLETATSVGELQKDLFVHYVDEIDALGPAPDGIDRTAGRQFAIAVNLRRPDSYAHVLSSTVIAGAFRGGTFIPVDGDAGTRFNESVRVFTCRFLRGQDDQIQDFVVGGGSDLIADSTVRELHRLLRDGC